MESGKHSIAYSTIVNGELDVTLKRLPTRERRGRSRSDDDERSSTIRIREGEGIACGPAMTSPRDSAVVVIPPLFRLPKVEPFQPFAVASGLILVAVVFAIRYPETFDVGERDITIHGFALRSSGERIERWSGRRSKRVKDVM